MEFKCPGCGAEFEANTPELDQSVECPECGHRFTYPEAQTQIDHLGPLVPSSVRPGQELNGFLIQETVGFGGMGQVFKAVQLSLDRVVVLKTLPPAFAEDPVLVRRFHEESSALSALNHPNIVTIYERGNVGKVYFFAMEFVDGQTLKEMDWDHRDVRKFVHVAKGVAAALSYAHERGVIHRDIKPANVMLSERGEVKVTDFGLAALMRSDDQEDEREPEAALMGTPAYMSPEQKENPAAVDGRSDIFSAGMMFYELLTGQRSTLPPEQPPSEVCPEADPRLDDVVVRCLREDPDQRYASAGALLEDLEEFSQTLDRAPPCPNCGKLNPVRSRTCTYCGYDLDEMFDLCPECKQQNRKDVRRCLSCGADLERGRTLVRKNIGMMLQQADRLRLDENFDEALDVLAEIREIEGRHFEGERQRAAALAKTVRDQRRETARRHYQEAKRILREGRFKEAIELFKEVPEDIRDTGPDIERTRRFQQRLAAERRSEAITNLMLLAVGLILVLVVLLFAFL